MSGLGEAGADAAGGEGRKRRGSPCEHPHSAEKRRREQEQRYLAELAELLSANLGELDSLGAKAEHGNILKKTVDQIQQITRLEHARRSGGASRSSATCAEKRRREQEQRYLAELAELLSANLGELDSLGAKAEHGNILKKTVDQIQQITRLEH
ncbi:nuclear receptor coactivator 1-like, partial [Passer montanus]|uniref:nuclear receptor coactivator 1-like n=1 Tax=Passer montanus TaxID=9160 RepID=UPI00195FC9BD